MQQTLLTSLGRIRTGMIAAGGGLLVTALLANTIGLGSGVGGKQSWLILSGLLVILSGLLGRKIFAVYRGTAVILVTGVLIVLLLEMGPNAVANATKEIGSWLQPATAAASENHLDIAAANGTADFGR